MNRTVRLVVIHSLCNTQKNLIPKQYNHIYIDIGDYFYLCFLDSFAKHTTLELFQWEFVARVLAQLFQIPFCFIQGNAHPGKWPANSGEESWAWCSLPIIPALSGVERKDSETKHELKASLAPIARPVSKIQAGLVLREKEWISRSILKEQAQQ